MSKNHPASEIHPQQVQSEFTTLISASKLAEYLDVSTRTLWRLRATGKLPQPVRLGGQRALASR